MTNYDKLLSKLTEIFQLDQADLDFGIYRIMNSKRDEIVRFLERDLLPQVKQVLHAAQGDIGSAGLHELETLENQIRNAGMNPDDSPKVRELRANYAGAGDLGALEQEVFNHLYNFFRRYYDEGDFLSLRRYKEGVYAIPYEGEEVKLHWANADQYYIKTAEHFRDYTFKAGGEKRVHFKLADAQTERDNNKETEKRVFILVEADPIIEENGELFLRFEYRNDASKRKQKDLNGVAEEAILSLAPAEWKGLLNATAPTAKEPTRTVLAKHLTDYTARNTFDYFIHKDLGGFLRRELDFYIKNEVMHLDDIEDASAPKVEQYLAKVRAIRRVASKIIEFLAQLEDFQKRLWLKKKFVVETQYLVTLNCVPKLLYNDIMANDAQRLEWINLCAIDEIEQDLEQPGYTIPLTLDFLNANPTLVVDTRHYNEAFTDSLLRVLGDLNELTDGLMFRSENFQALGVMDQRYRSQVQCIYIDPPYNTGQSEIIYKNSYRDASWLSLMNDRLYRSLHLLHKDACYAIAIDDLELARLCELVDSIFTDYDRNMVVVNHHPQGGMSHNVSRTHEYMLMLTPSGNDILKGKAKSGDIEYRSFMLSGPGDNKARAGRSNSFYALLVDDSNKIVGIEPSPGPSGPYPTAKTAEGYTRRYPISPNGEEKVWCRAYESAVKGLATGEIVMTEGGSIKLVVDTQGKRSSLMSNWTDSRYNAGPHGTALVAEILGNREAFSYPKSIYTVLDAVEAMSYQYEEPLILDFFGGSGTTGHAVINLNRDDGGRRKFSLVEMGTYFDTVLVPRIKKVTYAPEWKDGKPKRRATVKEVERSPRIIKVLRLESYEDALTNLEINKPNSLQTDLLASNDTLREDYMLHYVLEDATAGSQAMLNIQEFAHPFQYKLKVATDTIGETKEVNVDLAETFNWLLGLRVQTMDVIRGFHVVTGRLPGPGNSENGEKALIIWRDTVENPNDKLDEFFRKQTYNTLDQEFDVIYVNGDNNLQNFKRDDQTWKVRLIEEDFHRLMWDVENI